MNIRFCIPVCFMPFTCFVDRKEGEERKRGKGRERERRKGGRGGGRRDVGILPAIDTTVHCNLQ